MKKQELRVKLSDNVGQNTCRVFYFLAQILFNTSEKELGYYL